MYSYNITRHDSTNYSPFYLLYGREARIPVDLELLVYSENSLDESQRLELRENAEREAAKSIKKSVERNKMRYDRDRIEASFRPGQLVWRFHPVRKKGLTQAFLPQKSGPYIVVSQTGPVNYKIKLNRANGKSKQLVVNANDLCLVVSEMESGNDEQEFNEEGDVSQSKVYKSKLKRSPKKQRKMYSSSESGDERTASSPVKSSSGKRTLSSATSSSSASGRRRSGFLTVDPTVDDDTAASEEAVVVANEAPETISKSSTPINSSSMTQTHSEHGDNVVDLRRSSRARKKTVRLIDEIC